MPPCHVNPRWVKLWGPRFRDVYVEKYKGIGVCAGTKVCAKFVAFDSCFLKFFLIQYYNTNRKRLGLNAEVLKRYNR